MVTENAEALAAQMATTAAENFMVEVVLLILDVICKESNCDGKLWDTIFYIANSFHQRDKYVRRATHGLEHLPTLQLHNFHRQFFSFNVFVLEFSNNQHAE